MTSLALDQRAETQPAHQLEALHAQHTIDSGDLLVICSLANVDNIFERVESWSFEQFFGFATYLFITTESAETRQQLAQIMPKFGSRAVLSLVKILHHAQLSNDDKSLSLKGLATQSLGAINPHTLAIGLAEVFAQANATELVAVVAKVLVKISYESNDSILSLLPTLLPAKSWQVLRSNLVNEISFTSIRRGLEENSDAKQIAMKVLRKINGSADELSFGTNSLAAMCETAT